jgi:hypothetical protein
MSQMNAYNASQKMGLGLNLKKTQIKFPNDNQHTQEWT